MQTTLLEGSVRIGDDILKPGEAWIEGNVRKVNTDIAVAWKNGLFHFDNADLRVVMRQLERWYDIDVSFEGQLPEEKFEGELKRNLNLAQIMKLLAIWTSVIALKKPPPYHLWKNNNNSMKKPEVLATLPGTSFGLLNKKSCKTNSIHRVCRSFSGG